MRLIFAKRNVDCNIRTVFFSVRRKFSAAYSSRQATVL
nr:MAG TPA: hypothetical protein [Caudoviricetes sp.]